jgi:hypothetical protein
MILAQLVHVIGITSKLDKIYVTVVRVDNFLKTFEYHTRHQATSTKQPAPSTQQPAPSTKHPATSTQHLLFSFNIIHRYSFHP